MYICRCDTLSQFHGTLKCSSAFTLEMNILRNYTSFHDRMVEIDCQEMPKAEAKELDVGVSTQNN